MSLSNSRCTHTSPSGRRCRLPRAHSQSEFCAQHEPQRTSEPAAPEDLKAIARALGAPRNFRTANQVNHFLGRVALLLAHNQISLRKALAFSYISQLLLQSLSGVEREVQISQGFDAVEGIFRAAAAQASPEHVPSAAPQAATKVAARPGKRQRNEQRRLPDGRVQNVYTYLVDPADLRDEDDAGNTKEDGVENGTEAENE